MLNSPDKVGHYRALALEATDLALATSLDRVREKHELAAATWTALADLVERVAPVSRVGRVIVPRDPETEDPDTGAVEAVPCTA
jgi:hypothetical protein